MRYILAERVLKWRRGIIETDNPDIEDAIRNNDYKFIEDITEGEVDDEDIDAKEIYDSNGMVLLFVERKPDGTEVYHKF